MSRDGEWDSLGKRREADVESSLVPGFLHNELDFLLTSDSLLSLVWSLFLLQLSFSVSLSLPPHSSFFLLSFSLFKQMNYSMIWVR